MAKAKVAPRDPLTYPEEEREEACRLHDLEYGRFRIGHQITFKYTVQGARQDKLREVQVLLKTHDDTGNVMYTVYDWDVDAPTAAGHIRKYRSIYMWQVRDYGEYPIQPEVSQAFVDWETETVGRIITRAAER